MNTTLKTLKKRRGFIGSESLLLACAASAMSALHKFGAEDGPPAKKTVCFIKRSEGGDQELDSGGPGVMAIDGTKKALDGKKAYFGSGHAGASAKKAQFGHGIYDGSTRSKQVGIDGKDPLAPLAMAHAAALSSGQAFGARF